MIDLFIPETAIGWLYLTINDNKFCVSYLSDFYKEMEKLLTFSENTYDMQANRIYLDGEGKDLYLTAWRHDNLLFIVWECETDELVTELMKFDYDDFLNEFNKNFEVIREDYYTRFDWDRMGI
jgi:hypothetical protein